MRLRTLALAALVTGVAADTLAQAPSGTVDITIRVMPPASAHVEERYSLGPSAAPLELRVLTRPCATIGGLRVERYGVALGTTESRSGPWITYRDTSAAAGDSLSFTVLYDVRLAGEGVIPLVHLASPLARNDSARLGTVSVEVRFADVVGLVEFPHMTRQAPGEWSARYVAVPSLVEVTGIELARCDERAERGNTGGLVWRFFLLVGIMAAWVPLYLAWARRSGKSA